MAAATIKAKKLAGKLAAVEDAAWLRRQLLVRTDEVRALQRQLAEANAQAGEVRRLMDAKGSLCITDTAKVLGVSKGDMFYHIASRGWAYRRRGKSGWNAYQSRIQSGELVHRVRVKTMERSGDDCIDDHLRITAKGLAALAEEMKVKA